MKRILKNELFFFSVLLIVIMMPGGILANNNSAPKGFVENKGQILDQNHNKNTEVLFLYNGNGVKVQLRRSGYSYELYKTATLSDIGPSLKSNVKPEIVKQTTIASHRIDIDFLNANTQAEVVKEGEQQTVLNYYINHNAISNIKTYSKVIYRNVYNKVDLEFLFDKGSFKYNIILNQGADINDVKFLCKGASSIRQSNSTGLVFNTSLGPVEENIPFSYYSSAPDKNHKVDFKVKDNVISFFTDYNNKQTLIIDPSTNLVWGTYFGGNSLEYCTSNGIDASNNVYIAGYSLSTSNMATSGVYQSTLTGSFDAYLSKFNSNGVQLWGTYFGGTNFDIFYAIHVTPSGTVFATGDTGSTTNVASPGAHQITYGGGIDDAILVKFDSSGQLLWSTYMGGALHDIASAITVDSGGDIIIAGHSESPTAIATGGAYSTVYGLNYDAFINKFNTNGVRIWGTYYGDSGVDEAYGITTDPSNNIYITGFTNSSFGISNGGFQNIIGGLTDAFIAKFDPLGANLLWATYYGGAGDEKGTALQCDPATGNIYLGANTTSSNNIAGPGSYQNTIGSADDSFIAAFNSAGNRLWSTYYGGNDVDYINALVLDANKNILVSGQTLSTNAMSSTGAYQVNLASVGMYDAFVAKFSNTGTRKSGTYFGGTDNESSNAICIDNLNKIYISGETTSTVSISTPGSHNQNYNGNKDAFLAKFCLAPEIAITPAGTFTTCVNNTFTFTGSPGYASYLWNTGTVTNPLVVNIGSVAGTFYFAVTATDADGCDGTSDSVTVIVNLCTGVREISDMGSLTIFPNPASEVINLKIENSTVDKGMVELYSVIGEEMLKEETKGEIHTINVKQFSPGIYFLRYCAGSTKVTKKIVIE